MADAPPPGDDDHNPPPPDDEAEARRLLDELLGGSAEAIALCEGAVCLSTPRGMEVVDGASLERRPRVGVGGRLLGIAATDDAILMADDRGRLLRWDQGGAPGECRADPAVTGWSVASRGDRVALTGAGQVLLVDARDGSLLARGAMPDLDHASALFVAGDDEVLSAEGNMVVRLTREGRRLELTAHCTLGQGEIIALAQTRPDPGGEPAVVAFDEFGWLHVLRPGGATGLEPSGAIELELDGGVPRRAGIHCAGHQVMVASGTSFLHLLDLRPPPGLDEPVLMATVCAGMALADVVADDRRVYLADAFRGLIVLDRAMFEVCHDDPELARVALVDGGI